MVEKISNYIVDNVLYKNEKVEGDQRDIMIFGVKRIVEDIPKYIIIFLICLFCGFVKELIVILGVTIIYKIFVGGAHAQTNLECLIYSTVFFLAPTLLAKYISLSYTNIYILYMINLIISLYVIIKIAPSDTEEIPIINKEKRKQMKVKSIIVLILIYVIAFLFRRYTEYFKIVVYTLLLINICTFNIAYKFLRCTRGKDSEEFKYLY